MILSIKFSRKFKPFSIDINLFETGIKVLLGDGQTFSSFLKNENNLIFVNKIVTKLRGC